jgi:hypothetical protein
MAKSRRKTSDAVMLAADRPLTSLPDRLAQAANGEIARRAFDLYLARGGEHGRDVQDWLQAERELGREAHHEND